MTDNECPCGSRQSYSQCCGLTINDHSCATTAETLMRSRYTAFVQKCDKHILESWHSRTRPTTLNHDDHPVVWLSLEVHGCEKGGTGDDSGSVDYTTRYLEGGQLCYLREKGEFLKENELWYYLGGSAAMKKEKIERNKPCPCGSEKKFKRCCLHL